VPLDRTFIGRSYPAAGVYEVAREKIRDFTLAIHATDPVHLDATVARAAGHPDVLAPPTFLTVLAQRYVAQGPIADPALGLDWSRVVHGGQRFTAHRPVHAGDRLSVSSQVEAVRAAGANELLTIRTDVSNAGDGAPVATLLSTIISRGTA
jgi:acyl dehydratase